MINGVHALIHAKEPEKARAFFRDVLEWEHVDAGDGWLIFAMPPAEVGVHPLMEGEEQRHEVYLMCEDIEAAVKKIEAAGIECSEVQNTGWGKLTSFQLPGGGPMGMYEPLHPVAIRRQK